MDLSPSEPPFGGLGAGGPGPSSVWSLPSPSTLSAQHAQPHDLNINNAQQTADGKESKEKLFTSHNYLPFYLLNYLPCPCLSQAETCIEDSVQVGCKTECMLFECFFPPFLNACSFWFCFCREKAEMSIL